MESARLFQDGSLSQPHLFKAQFLVSKFHYLGLQRIRNYQTSKYTYNDFINSKSFPDIMNEQYLSLNWGKFTIHHTE